MTKKERFSDKDFIIRCDMPSELFTVKGIKREYRALAKLWHPDVAHVKEALFVMSKINALYNEGQALIAENKFYEKERLIYRNKQRSWANAANSHGKDDEAPFNEAPFNETSAYREPFVKEEDYSKIKRSKRKLTLELKSSEGKTIRFKYLKRLMIELGYLYISETHILLEVTKLKKKIFMDSLALVQSVSESVFKLELPEVIDTFDTKTHGYIVIKKESGVESITLLESVMGYLKPLGSRKICEGIFYDLMALKYMGLTSTALDKDLWFIDVDTGKLMNYGHFFYLHEFSSKLSRGPKNVTEALRELTPKDTESLVIDLVKSSMTHLNEKNGLKIDDFHRWLLELKSDSIEKSLAESQVFNRSIASVTTHGFDLEGFYQSISAG